MKFTLARADRPRNPMVAPALFRQAGNRRHQAAAERQRGQRTLAGEIRQPLHAVEETSVATRTRLDPPSP